MNATHYLITDGNGNVVGTGYTPDGTLPENAHPCDQGHVKTPHLCSVNEADHTITIAPPGQAEQILAQIAALERQQTPEMYRQAIIGSAVVNSAGRTAAQELAWIDGEIEALKNHS